MAKIYNNRVYVKIPAVDRFWKKIKKMDSGCWEWIGCRNAHGYGHILNDEGKLAYCHRFSYELHKKASPGCLYVCHKCDNTSCCNPDHLFLGTQKDNLRDAISKGRLKLKTYPFHFGENHHSSKLTESSVKQLRKRYANGEKIVNLSKEFGLSNSSTWKAVSRFSWKHIKEDVVV